MKFKHKVLLYCALSVFLGGSSCLQATEEVSWLTKVPEDLQLYLMKITVPIPLEGKDPFEEKEKSKEKSIAWHLYSVNQTFYTLAHHQELEETIWHVISFPEDFAAVHLFLPAVKLGFLPSSDEFSRLQECRFLDISQIILQKEQIFALDKMPALIRVNLGSPDSNGYILQAYNDLKSKDNNDKQAGLALCRIILKDPCFPRHLETALSLLYHGNEDDKKIFKNFLNFSQKKEDQVGIIARINKYRLNDSDLWAIIKKMSQKLINDDDLDIEKQIELLHWVGPTDISPEAYSRFLRAIDPKSKVGLPKRLLAITLNWLLDCPYLEIQKKTEELLFHDFLRLGIAYEMYAKNGHALKDRIGKFPAEKKNLWLSQICQCLKLPAADTSEKLLFACLVLSLSDQPDVFLLAQKAIKESLIEKPDLLHRVSAQLLNHLTNAPLKQDIVSMLENSVQTIDLTQGPISSTKESALVALLTQKDAPIRDNAIKVCQNLINLVKNQGDWDQHKNFFGNIGWVLSQIKEGRGQAQQFYELLKPKFEHALQAHIDDLYKHDLVLKLFMAMGDEEQKQTIYNLCLNLVAKATNEDDLEAAVEIVTDGLGASHAWSQEITTLMENRKSGV